MTDDTRVPDPGNDETTPGPAPVGASGEWANPYAPAEGQFIGAYKLLGRIGAGGMGDVWRAERRDGFRQAVALKLLSVERIDRPESRARFEREREILASLSHPNVARILDGGVHFGRPWFAMELVPGGMPITEYCDSRELPTDERLRLFREVCEALKHAHLKAVVHRDLKPSNVLVGPPEPGGRAQVKVIDFGIAKLLGPGDDGRSAVSREHFAIGTLEYMPPEQADPGPGRTVDTRADVYSLGVILYELLAGVKPFDIDGRMLQRAREIILHEEPPTPSARLSTVTRDSEAATRISRSRCERIEALIGRLRSELEWIPLMAMRKDPARRYETVKDLAADVDSYLAGRPLIAAPESRWYLARKFVARHRPSVAGTVAAAVGLVAAAAVASALLVARGRALDAAEERELELMEVLEFQARALAVESKPAGPQATYEGIAAELALQAEERMRGLGIEGAERAERMTALRTELGLLNGAEALRVLTRSAVVKPAVDGIDALEGPDRFRERVRALLLMSYGQGEWALGFEQDAGSRFREAASINAENLGEDADRTLWARSWATRSDPETGRPDLKDAASAARILDDDYSRRFGRDSAKRATALRLRRDLDGLLPGGLPIAVELAKRIAEQSRVGADPWLATDDRLALGELLAASGDPQGAEAELEAVRRAVGRPGAPAELRAHALMALGMVRARDAATAEDGIALLREAVAAAEGSLGDGHRTAFLARSELASGLQLARPDDPDATAEAEGLRRRSIDIERRTKSAPRWLSIDRVNMAVSDATKGYREADAARARALAEESRAALDAVRDRFGRESDTALRAQRAVAVNLALLRDFDGAHALLREAVSTRARLQESPGTMEMLTLAFERGRALRALGRVVEARAVLEDAQEAARRERPATSESRWLVATLLLSVLEESGADEARVDSQRREVAALRAAVDAMDPEKKSHGCSDWRDEPWPDPPTPR
jgi:serine/threonine protein kinase